MIPSLVLNFSSVTYTKYGADLNRRKRRTILKLHGEETNLEEISDGIPFVFETRRAVNEARLPLEFAPGGDGSAIRRVFSVSFRSRLRVHVLFSLSRRFLTLFSFLLNTPGCRRHLGEVFGPQTTPSHAR